MNRERNGIRTETQAHRQPNAIMGCLVLLALAFPVALPGCVAGPGEPRASHPAHPSRVSHPSRLEVSATAPVDPGSISAGRAPVVTVSVRYTIEFGKGGQLGNPSGRSNNKD
jgi:hypothetical protein